MSMCCAQSPLRRKLGSVTDTTTPTSLSPVATVTAGEYLARRLREVGVEHLFGVPGDFNLTLLDTVAATGLLQWVGSPNELGAGYAADGYARRRGFGAVVTTYGVGELSCLNAVAGSAAESVPVLQITGAPATAPVAAGRLLHHTLADGDFGHFARAYTEVTVAQEVLAADRAGEQIDTVISAALAARRPAYLSIPADLVTTPVDAARLETPLCAEDPAAWAAVEQAFTGAARAVLDAAERPVLVVGHVAARFGLAGEIVALAEAAGMAVVAQAGAKGHVDERHPLYAGVYAGDLGDPYAAAVVEKADAVVQLGTVRADVLSGFWTDRPDDGTTVRLDAQSARVGAGDTPELPLPRALRALRAAATTRTRTPHLSRPVLDESYPEPGEELTQATFWQTVQAWLLELPGDTTLLADLGTAFWGALGLTLPAGTELVAQPIWSSIGYTLPATAGAGLADPDRRPVLVIGDGAAQMTVQDLSTIAANGLTPVVILLNNAGYTIERALQSPQAAYNDLAAWPWLRLAADLTGDRALTRQVDDLAGLRAALEEAGSSERMAFLDVVLDPHDAPPLLRGLAATVEVSR